jgi:hypothetical protein
MWPTGIAVAGVIIVFGACSTGQKAATRVACASAEDCYEAAVASNNNAYCCFNNACVLGNGGTSIVDCTDANVQLIQASSYNQSCTTASDCVAVSEGNACYPGFLDCPQATINVGAQARYNADVARTNGGICSVMTSCTLESSPCCLGGTCQMGDQCIIRPGDAATDADAGTPDAAAGG